MGKTRSRKDRDNACDETRLYLQEPCLERKIPETELLSITEVPEGLDVNEWLALHTIGFFEHVNLIYGTVSEFCTLSSCPDMVGPGPRQYMWMDDKGKKSRLSSPQYVDYVMTYVQKTANDESIFPTKHGHEFPPNFDQIIKKIHRLLFHVIAHIYHAHFREVVLLGLHAHLNSLFAHLIEFNIHYHTIEDKETEVLQDLIHALRLLPTGNNNSEETRDMDMATLDSEEEEADRESQAEVRARSPDTLDNQPLEMDTTSVELSTEAEVLPASADHTAAEALAMDTTPDSCLADSSAGPDAVEAADFSTNNDEKKREEGEKEGGGVDDENRTTPEPSGVSPALAVSSTAEHTTTTDASAESGGGNAPVDNDGEPARPAIDSATEPAAAAVVVVGGTGEGEPKAGRPAAVEEDVLLV